MSSDTENENQTALDEAQVDTDDVLEEIQRKRSITGIVAVFVAFVGISFSAFQMWIAARGYTFDLLLPTFDGAGLAFETRRIAGLQQLQVNTIHVAFALVLAFILYPASTGEGRVAGFCGRIVDRVGERFGSGSPLTRAAERLRGFARWAVVDENKSQVKPADVVLATAAILPALYTTTQFDEISSVLRVRGLSAGRPLPEVVPALEPIAVGPLADTSLAFLLGVLGVLLVLEATRRVLGLLLMGLVSLFIVYAYLGHHIPRGIPGVGVFSITETPWRSLIRDLWYNSEAGIHGRPVGVSVRFIYIFILFGAFLEMSGAGEWFIDLAYSLTGTRRGGPAKASTVSSGFMGMLSGSSVANTVTTGAFTIPLMKRSGYSPEFSGAVESSVSSGGQILPPVMGAAAFLIVEFTGTPYREVIIAASLPAIAFFFGMWVMVHFEASRRDVGGLDRSDLLPILPHLKKGWFYLVPIFLLLYYLVIARLSINRAGWFTILSLVVLIAVVAAYDDDVRVKIPFLGALTLLFAGTAATQYVAGVSLTEYLRGARNAGLEPTEAAFAAVGSAGLLFVAVSLAVMLLRPKTDSPILELDDQVYESAEAVDETVGVRIAKTRPGTFAAFVLKSMDSGARTATLVVVAVAAAGIIPGVISVTGLGPNLTRLIILASAESFLLLLVLAGIGAVILGMGMPTTVMYIILVSVMGGALEEFGVALIAAHLFVLYLGLMADVTPPVMVAAYAAAGVAKSEAFETGKLAFMLSLNKILVPFAFVYAPGILLIRDWGPGGIELVGFSDLLDVSYFVPEVLIPVLGMFVGVYALGVTIIGYRSAEVPGRERALHAVAAVMMMVPALFLAPAGGLIALTGLDTAVHTTTTDVLMRLGGGVLFTALLRTDIRRGKSQPESGTDTQESA